MTNISYDWVKPQLSNIFSKMKTNIDWLNIATPWITTGAREWLSANITRDDACLEYGGGRSSIWWTDHAKHVTVVEASLDWTFAILAYLTEYPERLKRLRFYFVPSEWNPEFGAFREYWTLHKKSISLLDGNAMERDLIVPDFPGHNIIVFDGSVRPLVFAYKCSRLDEQEIIVIDNTEEIQHGLSAYLSIPEEQFDRLDFVERNVSVIPTWQNGKHITSIFVRKTRGSNLKERNAGGGHRLTLDEYFDYLELPLQKRLEAIENTRRKLMSLQNHLLEIGALK